MKRLLSFLVLLISIESFGQQLVPQSKYSPINGVGFIYKRHIQDSVSAIPLSTSPHVPYRAGGIRYNILCECVELWNGTEWKKDLRAIQLTDSSFQIGDSVITIRNTGNGTSCPISGILNGTDISTQLQALINSGCKNITIPRGVFTIGTTVQMKDSVTITGEGKASVIKLLKNIPAFKCSWSGGGNKAIFKDFSFYGTYSDSTLQDGIFIDSCNGVYVNNISAFKLAGWAVRIRRNGFCCAGYPTPTGVLGNIVSDCWMDSCYGGVKHDTLAEFNSTVNCTAVNGVYSFFTAGGSSRFSSCNGSGSDYGIVVTGGSNNAHGTIVNSHFAHNRRQGIYVTGATNGYEFIGCNARQDSITIENSDNIRFTSCELGANSRFNILNSTNTTIAFPRIWGPPPYNIVNSNVRYLAIDSATNGISVVDLPNSKRFDISHTDGIVDFTGRGVTRIRSVADTINFSSTAPHYVAGGENANDSLILTSTTNATKGRVKFGTSSTGLTFLESNGNLGLGTTNPTNKVDLRGSGILNINIQPDAGGHSRMTFNVTPSSATIGAQFLFGDTTSPFTPGGLLISSISKFLALGCTNDDIRFVKTTTINGTNEHARFTNNGSFLFSTTTNDPTKGRFQLHSRVRIDSTLYLQNVAAPPSTYNVLVHGLTDSGTYMIPVSDLGTASITSINSHTGPAITIQGGTAISVDNSISNTVTLNVTPGSNALPHTLDAQYTTAGNTGTSETDLFTYTLPASKLGIDGRTVNFEIDGEFNDNTSTAQLKLYFGGNVTLNTGAVNISTAFTKWKLTGYVMRASSSTAHVTYELQCPGLATPLFLGYSNLTSLDFTTTNVFKITAQAGGAGASNSDITAHSWQLLYKPQPQ